MPESSPRTGKRTAAGKGGAGTRPAASIGKPAATRKRPKALAPASSKPGPRTTTRQRSRSTAARRGEEQLLGALGAGLPVEQAAKSAGVSERTVYRRLREPRFQQKLAAVRDELVSIALGELAASASHAVATLEELLDASDERVRLQAARTLLEQLLRLREAITLEQRVAILERRLNR